MPSPDLLPRGRSFPSVAPPPLEDVLGRARRRRAQRAGVAGVLAVAAIAAAALAFVPHDSSQTLDVVTPAVHGPSPSLSPHVPAVRGVPHALAVSKAHSGQRPPATRPVATSKDHAATATTSHARQPSTTNRPAAARPIVGPAHRTMRYEATQACSGSGPSVATGWCSYYDGAMSGVAGRVVTLATAVCRLPGQGTGVLASSNGQQADFAVGKNAYPPKWTWSHGRTFAKHATSISVPAGTCVQWYVSWRVVTDAGKPLAPGTYYLDATPDMAAANVPASAGQYNPTTFTVR